MNSCVSTLVLMSNMFRKSNLIIAFVLVSLTSIVFAREQKGIDKWESYKFLLGEWVGEGSGQPGQGEGGSTFTLELNNNILIRKSHNNIPAANDRPADNHEDIMVIYREPRMPVRAFYWDNEGHNIAYGVEFSSDGKILTFLSDVKPEEPRFRLTYEKLAVDTLKVSFEYAPPGRPDEFALYTSGVIHRR